MASTPPARPRSGLGSSRRRTPGTSGRHPSSGTASVGSAGATDPVTDTRLAAPPRSPYDRYLISAKPIRMPKLIPSDPLVGHSVRSSVLCGPVSCREVDHVATTNESVARLECGGADGVDAVEPVAAYAGGSGRAGGGVAGGCRRAELHSRRAEGRTPR